ncbi:YiiX/YebB-like N1pC/P60 family cysteine hydrolase [Bacteriovorax sp. PP10]|uniref:YiiX/YebB-like N1pC/P60 family cysteine hydrolase n=1 Tax=Bacteriovorax antarcticus TaxID=3088717 RepID=A0ABU5VVI5_9BACT|nr:YiiX/YebB-like N1pC/P60 family cysteine hydrolase [Bacteriovorax sp. PP10]MEA9357067.1 YiiX/YebB-like N1pC/P60 family cysteine hydrolase [Bacteriovorax sp. PP10]
MKKLILISLLTLVSCSNFTRTPASPPEILTSEDVQVNEVLASEVAEFQVMVEEALVWRAKAMEFAEKNAKKLKRERLTHEDIQSIHESAQTYLNLRERLMKYASKYQSLVDDGTIVKYVPGEKTSKSLNVYYIDPLDAKGQELLFQTKISLNAALVLYDSYMLGLYPYYKSRKMRKLLNTDFVGGKFEFDEITDSFFDVTQRTKMYLSIQLFDKDIAYKEASKTFVSAEEKYLDLLALQSPFYNFMKEKYKSIVDPSSFKNISNRIFDRSSFVGDLFTYSTSKVFGNSVGLIAFRKGRMTKISRREKAHIKENMKPLDILLEKTPFRLTDKFIPGFYGHVAIWVGNEDELKALGVWDNPVVKPYQEAIKDGHFIIEALRPGVQINTLDHFLNIDDLLVLRDPSLTDEQRKEFLVRAFAQIGKDYDFNFDVETDKKIVCSEIVYVVFHNIDWPTEKALGRFTISPDNVAAKVSDGVLVPVQMYSDGEKVEGDLIKAVEEKLKE